MQNEEKIEAVVFLTDVTSYLNDFNVKLEGRNNTVTSCLWSVLFRESWCLNLTGHAVIFLKLLEQTRGKKLTFRTMLCSWRSWLNISKHALRSSAWENNFCCALETHFLSEMSQNSRLKDRESAPGSTQLLCKLSWLSSEKTCFYRKPSVTLSLSGHKRSLIKMLLEAHHHHVCINILLRISIFFFINDEYSEGLISQQTH